MKQSIGTLGGPQMHALGDGFDRQRGFLPQPAGDGQLGRIAFAPSHQFLFRPAQPAQLLGHNPTGFALRRFPPQVSRMVVPQLAFQLLQQPPPEILTPHIPAPPEVIV